MLVLSRKREEKLQIGDDIVVTILKVKGNSVQIGIEAPRSVRVLRAELAAKSPAGDSTAAAQPQAEAQREPAAPQRRATARGPLRSHVTRQAREGDAPVVATLQLV